MILPLEKNSTGKSGFATNFLYDIQFLIRDCRKQLVDFFLFVKLKCKLSAFMAVFILN